MLSQEEEVEVAELGSDLVVGARHFAFVVKY